MMLLLWLHQDCAPCVCDVALPRCLAGGGQGGEAKAEAVKMLGVYSDLATSVMCIPVISGAPDPTTTSFPLAPALQSVWPPPPPPPPPPPLEHRRTYYYRHTHVLADRQPLAVHFPCT